MTEDGFGAHELLICMGHVVRDESFLQGHPKLYNSSDVTPDLMARLRRTISWLPKGKCANETTYKASREAFLEPPLRSEELDCEDILKIPDMNPMDSVCHMFFRKFDASAVPGLLELMTKGPGDAAILSQ